MNHQTNLVEQDEQFLRHEQEPYTETSNRGHKGKLDGEKPGKELTIAEPLTPPDGGYGWVVLFACFTLQCFVPGMLGIFGVFLPQFLDYFKASRGKTAIIGSMISAGTMIPGPFVSVLASIFGCRKVAMIGGIFITAGLLLSTLAPSVNVLILTFGAITGLGTGLIYLPLIVMVGFYFEKKRAIAMGITTSGAGFGMMVLGSLSGIFLENVDWKNALMLMCCLTLQCVACGALLRPVEHKKPRQPDNKYDIIKAPVADQRLVHLKGEQNHPLMHSSLDTALNQVNERHQPSQHLPNVNHLRNDILRGSRLYPVVTQKNKGASDVYYSEQNISKIKYNKPQVAFNPLLKKDIFYSGSIKNIHQESKYHQENIGSKTASTEDVSRSSCQCIDAESVLLMKKMLGISILTDMSFLIILITNALFHTGYVICICFITDFGISVGVPSEKAAQLVSSFGIGTTIGRILAGGIVTYIPKVGPVQATSISLILAGLCSLSIPLFGKTLLSLLIWSGFTGFFLAPIIPLTAVMQVDFLGIDNLTNAHGMVSLGKGIISLLGAPIAGLLQDVTGSYSPPFYLTAAILILAGGLVCCLSFCSKRNTD